MDDRPVARRCLLIGLGVLAGMLAAGCTGDDDDTIPPPGTATASGPIPTPAPTTTVDPDTATVDAVRRDEDRLVAAYRSVGQRRPELRILQAHHRHHVRLLGGEPSHAAPTRPRQTTRAALKWLRGLETQAAAHRRGDALAAVSGDLARVLAAMAASSAQHVVVLDALSATSRRDPA